MDRLLPELCGSSPSNPLPVWDDGSIGNCFNQLVLNALPHLLLALTSACFVGTPRLPGSEYFTVPAWKFRIAASFFFAFLSVIDLIIAAFYLPQGTISLEVLAGGISALSWITHGVALLKLSRSAYRSSRGPLVLLVLALLPVPTLVITLLWHSQNSLAYPLQLWPLLKLIVIGLQMICLVAYLLSFVAPISRQHCFPSIHDTSQPIPLLSDSGTLIPDWRKVDENHESWMSRLFFIWMDPLLERGYKKDLKQPDELYHLPYSLRTHTVSSRFRACWLKKKAHLEKVAVSPIVDDSNRLLSHTNDISVHCPLNAQKEVPLLSVLNSTFGLRYYSLGMLRLIASLLSFAGPLLLNRLVNFMETRQEPLSHGLLYTFGLFASAFLSAILYNQFTYEVQKVELMVRAAVVSSIYRKALWANNSGLSCFSTGEIVNFISNDSEQLILFCGCFHEVWCLPLEFAITFCLLYQQVGLASLAGLGFTLLLVPINKWISDRMMSTSIKMMEHKDTRLKLMSEILRGIQVIKFYTWEKHFAAKVKTMRDKELEMLKTNKYLEACATYLWEALPVLIAILIFTVYVLLGHKLTAATVFTALALIAMLITPLNIFPWMITEIVEAKVSLDRIERFLQVSDQDLDFYYTPVTSSDPDVVLELHNASFSWCLPSDAAHTSVATKEEPKGALETIIHHLTVKRGALVGVVGKVGCGKSSLLAAITGELNRKGGCIYVSDQESGFGLAAQEPWIQFATVRENILFGRKFDTSFYQEVVEACALMDDLSILPAGDDTKVGENGVTLSGGQKARIALARAIYQNKDIYLLDDPLAAVDADVASHLLEKCILGILKNKTRILCTHRTEFLEKADFLVLMDEGKIVQTGTPSEILPLVEASLKHHSRRRKKVSIASLENDCDEEEDDKEQGNSHANDVSDLEGEEMADETTHCQAESSQHFEGVDGEAHETEESGYGQFSKDEEEKKEGLVSFRVYRSYWNAVGTPIACAILFIFLLMQASYNLSSWWLTYWVSSLQNHTEGNVSISGLSAQTLLSSQATFTPSATTTTSTNESTSEDLKFYLTVYGCIAAVDAILTFIRSFMFAFGTIRAASVLHDRLLIRVIKATMTFFNTTPMGRIINRFSSDLHSTDDTLPFVINVFLASFFGLMGMVVMISYGLPWIILLLLPLGFLCFYIQHYYRHTARELKRLCSITLSPIYTHFSETLTGLSTIRASREAGRFEKENEEHLERNQRCQYANNTAMQWLDIRLQMMGVVVITAIAIIAIIQHYLEAGSPGLVGLALSYALSVNRMLSELISYFTRTETMMVSVERIEEYSSEIPKEPEDELVKVAPSWPKEGLVEFQDAFLTYRPGLPNALDGVNFTISPGEKVGIVGRTGSGKSTIFTAMFRMMELNQGQILIDNINILLVDLEALRSKLAIIPQDPFLFSGAVRENLDPWGRCTDAELYHALEQCHLKEVVTRMGGLSAEVGERGKRFSVGQRQLLCLARALLTDAKILCIDEATASVDHKTDQVLQQTIREQFIDKTVLTIAHRLNTIMDSDRVLVMHSGKVVEMGPPQVLCDQEDSIFRRLVHGEEQ